MKVRNLPQEALLLIQDLQERRAVLESAGLPMAYEEEYPTLFVLVGDAEILKVWGITTFVPYLEERAETLYDKGVGA